MSDLSMTLDNYQIAARSTAVYPGSGTTNGLLYVVLGLANEAGEVAGKVKKYLRDDDPDLPMSDERRMQIMSECSDVLWYVALTATELGFDLSDIADHNLSKLADRAARGKIKGDGDAR